jgi:hypothetical protein
MSSRKDACQTFNIIEENIVGQDQQAGPLILYSVAFLHPQA